ncbi:hypothetical protein QQ045_029693 [Rhodiola kirilowii]
MDSKLTEVELVTLNKLVDEVEKLNKQLQRFVQQVATCGLDDPCDVEVKPIDSETSSQHLGIKYSSKSNNLIKSVTTVDASCEKVQKCDLVVDEYPKEDHDSLEVNTIADQSIVGDSVQTQSISYILTPILKERSAKLPAKPPDNIYNLDVDDLRALVMILNDTYEEESSLLSFLDLWKHMRGVHKFLQVKVVDGHFVYDKGKRHKYKKKNDLRYMSIWCKISGS